MFKLFFKMLFVFLYIINIYQDIIHKHKYKLTQKIMK